MFSFFFSVSSSCPFTSSQTRWSDFVWLSCPGFGWPTGESSLSWRAPPGPQTAAGAVCCAVGRCCWHRDSWSIWCPEVCLYASYTKFYFDSQKIKNLLDFHWSSYMCQPIRTCLNSWSCVSYFSETLFILNRFEWIRCLVIGKQIWPFFFLLLTILFKVIKIFTSSTSMLGLTSLHPFISLSNSCSSYFSILVSLSFCHFLTHFFLCLMFYLCFFSL